MGFYLTVLRDVAGWFIACRCHGNLGVTGLRDTLISSTRLSAFPLSSTVYPSLVSFSHFNSLSFSLSPSLSRSILLNTTIPRRPIHLGFYATLDSIQTDHTNATNFSLSKPFHPLSHLSTFSCSLLLSFSLFLTPSDIHPTRLSQPYYTKTPLRYVEEAT